MAHLKPLKGLMLQWLWGIIWWQGCAAAWESNCIVKCACSHPKHHNTKHQMLSGMPF